MKVPDKNIPKQTKEEEIGSFPEKDFRIVREKTTQILKVKWSCQQIHWRPGLRRKQHVYHASRRNKDKKKKAVIINAITEISKALEGTKSKISETEKELTYVQSAS